MQCIVRLVTPQGKTRPVAVFEKMTEPGLIKAGTPRGILARELVRQALLLTAQEELGLATRDLALDEADPPKAALESPAEIVLTCYFPLGKAARLSIVRKVADQQTILWKKEIPLAPDWQAPDWDYRNYATELELISRQEWPRVLQEAGFGAPRAAKVASAKFVVDSERLESLSDIVLWGALRELHIAIRAEGESAEALGGLARGYAHLGMATDFHFHPRHKIFKARALLYAQRLLVRQPGSPWGLWHRAGASAIMGRHDSALADLEAAAKLEAAAGRARPDWVNVIDAYCKFDTNRLRELGAASSLARLLLFSIMADGGSSLRTIAAAEDVLKESPECYRVWDSLGTMEELSLLHRVTVAAPEVLSTRLGVRLRTLSDLPQVVKPFLVGDELEPDKERRALEALATAGRLGEDDVAGLAWSTLAALIRDTRFMQVKRRVEFMRVRWSVPTNEFMAEAQPWVADHPLAQILEPLPVAASGAPRTTIDVDKSILDMRSLGALKNYIDFAQGRIMAREHQDLVYQDLIAAIAFGNPAEKPARARQLMEYSPYSPRARVLRIENDWLAVKAKAQEWENSLHPEVLGALGKRYYQDSRREDAKRCLHKYLETSDDFWAYNYLAGIYQIEKNDEKFLETFEKFLQSPNLGLEHARVQVTIANHLRAKGEKEKALSYAEAAAETWAEWAMQCASQCNEDLENWDRAEMWIRRASERYPAGARNWMNWCQRTGKGDLKAATQVALGRARETGGNEVDELYLRSNDALLNRQWESAFGAYKELHKRTKDQQWLLYIALTADALKDVQARDAALDMARGHARDGKLAAHFRDALKETKGVLNLAAVDQALAAESGGFRTDHCCLVGWFLELHGQKDQAMVYYDRCATGPASRPLLRSFAIEALRANGLEPGKLKAPGRK
jgi:tetratricopeptide (TPR) repeat protein